eukprot:3876103-Karenia_brevis.AAC.1
MRPLDAILAQANQASFFPHPPTPKRGASFFLISPVIHSQGPGPRRPRVRWTKSVRAGVAQQHWGVARAVQWLGRPVAAPIL